MNILQQIQHATDYKVIINPHVCEGLEYFKKFEYPVHTLGAAILVPEAASGEILKYFREEILVDKKVKNIELFELVLKRSSVEIVRSYEKRTYLKIMIWYHYRNLTVPAPTEKLIKEALPVKVKLA